MTIHSNLNITRDAITFQPFLRSKKGGLISFLVAIVFIIIVYLAQFKEETTYSLYIFSVLLVIYGAYYYFIDSKFVIEFNKTKKAVYKKIPGLYNRKLIAFSDINNIAIIYTNGNPHYCITHRENMFGKNYAITEYFNDTNQGVAARDDFETYILPSLLKCVSP